MTEGKPGMRIAELAVELSEEAKRLAAELAETEGVSEEAKRLAAELAEKEMKIAAQDRLIERLAQDVGKLREVEQELREGVSKLEELLIGTDESGEQVETGLFNGLGRQEMAES
jgi:hypothetical protein